jgi:protein-disulfide isomerase
MTQLIPAVNSNDHIHGDPAAILELVEYGDYECSYCGRAYPIVKNIQRRLGDHLKFVFRNFPLSRIHPHAFPAAVATEAAGLQHKFWEMHDIVFENQRELGDENITRFAGEIGLDIGQFKNDIHQIELLEKVKQDFSSGIRSGVNRTPSFFINGEKYEGSWEENNFLRYLEARLRMLHLYNT